MTRSRVSGVEVVGVMGFSSVNARGWGKIQAGKQQRPERNAKDAEERRAEDAEESGGRMVVMANLVLVYGMRLLPADEVVKVGEAPIELRNGHEAGVTMHVLEGSREEIEAQLKLSVDAFFDFYPER